jgi:hypothetical protein
VSKDRIEVGPDDIRPGDVFVKIKRVGFGAWFTVDRESIALPTATGSIGIAVTGRGREIVARPAIGDRDREWVSLSSGEWSDIWRKGSDFQEYTPLVVHQEVLYGDVRDVFYEHSVAPMDNAVVIALTNLANKGNK